MKAWMICYNMASDSGLQLENRKITNTSLRVAAFHVQEQVGIDSESGRQFSGHISRGTAATYRRKNDEMSNRIGGAIVSMITGSEAIVDENLGTSLTKNLPLNK